MANTINLHVNNIAPGNNVLIETKTDAQRYLMTARDVDKFIAEFGNVAVKYDDRAKVWRVPEFADQIAVYCKMKMEQCRRWGSN